MSPPPPPPQQPVPPLANPNSPNPANIHHHHPPPQTYLIIGASRGIGLEFCRQLLAANQRVIATARHATGASRLWPLTGSPNGSNLSILECDVADELSVARFVAALKLELGRAKRLSAGSPVAGAGAGGWGGRVGGGGGEGEKGGDVSLGGVIDVCVMNAGVLVYPNRIMEVTYSQFAHHLTTNTIGPLLLAASLLRLSSASASSSSSSTTTPTSPTHTSTATITIRTLVFMSSDSASAARFRSFEDGFAAYAASKAALNQGLRHLAAELARRPPPDPARHTVVLALHPGEVATDVAPAPGGPQDWDVEGIISPDESVRKMLRVVRDKGAGGVHERGGEPVGVATFWDWEGRPYPW